MKMTKLFYCCLVIISFSLNVYSQTDTWTRKKDIGYYYVDGPSERSFSVAFSISGKGYVGTGSYDDVKKISGSMILQLTSGLKKLILAEEKEQAP